MGCAETSDEYGTHLMMEIVAAFNAVSSNYIVTASYNKFSKKVENTEHCVYKIMIRMSRKQMNSETLEQNSAVGNQLHKDINFILKKTNVVMRMCSAKTLFVQPC